MSRLDRHIVAIQNKLTLRLFLQAMAWCAVGIAGVGLLDVLVERFFSVSIPRPGMSLLIAAIMAAGCSLAYAIYCRPTAMLAAVAIDQELNLKEKFSTALFARPLSDPFARAAVSDAERTADNVSLHRRFPPQYPKQTNGAIALSGAALLVAWLLPNMDLFGHAQRQQELLAESQQKQVQAQEIKKEIALLAPLMRPSIAPEAVKLAKHAEDLLAHSEQNPDRTNATVASQMTDAANILKKIADEEARWRVARENEELLKNLANSTDDGSPMSKVQNEIKNQNFDQATSDLTKAVEQFTKMAPKQQQDVIKKAQTLAAALNQAANNPQIQQQINNQISQLTRNPQLAQQLAQAVSNLAQGSPSAQQQMSKLTQQIASKMNSGQGATAEQMQAIQHLMAGIQAKANSQAQAQAMAQAAQQLAQAMAQSAKAQQGGNSKPGQQQQTMAAAQQNLQKQMNNMQVAQQDAQAMAAAQQAAQQAANQAANAAAGQNNGGGQNNNNGNGQQLANGGQKPGQPGGQNQGPPGPNHPNAQGYAPGAGWAPRETAEAPATFEKEYDPTQDQGKGRMLASSFIHSDIDKGTKTAQDLKNIAESMEQTQSEDMDEDQVPKESEKAVKDYYDKLQQQQ
ncbi:MAG TPA: hypothetical protein VMD30_05930 [Tepidisphaeraceae bacterium]|nr:hypothetical protein [Tepidisphaeraceae bacterium]